MPANHSRSASRLAVLVMLVLLVAGWGGQTKNASTASGQSTTSTTVADAAKCHADPGEDDVVCDHASCLQS